MIGWLLHWLAIHTGTLNEPGPYYGFWSGFGSDIGEVVLIGGMIGLYRKHNCHVKGCWRLARHPVPGTDFIVCRRHLPGEAPSHQDVIDAHHAAKRRHSGEAGERMHPSAPKD